MNVVADKNYVLAHLNLYERHASKQWGQNFLIDDELAKAIVDSLDVKEKDTIIEIGPGLGALTFHLCKKPNRLIAAEIDPVMVEHLKKTFESTQLEIFADDFLKFSFEKAEGSLRVIGNLPYYITTDIIEKLLLSSDRIDKMVLMVQKEAYERMTASLGNKDYGPLSLLFELLGTTKIIKHVKRNSYYPQPNVDSLVFSFEKTKKIEDLDVKKFYRLLKNMFLARRKTMLNNLLKIVKDKEETMKILDELGMPYNKRPENGDLEFYLRLNRRLQNK